MTQRTTSFFATSRGGTVPVDNLGEYMSVSVRKGDLFDEKFEFSAIGHGVNVDGLMGAGIAKEFRRRYPSMFNEYKHLCKYEILVPGGCFFWASPDIAVLNLASQDRPGPNAKTKWLAQSLFTGLMALEQSGRPTLGLPWIGCGIGGLDQGEALEVIEETAQFFPTVNITICEL
jgi:O-acetyl-ADP-ribose deacetylase (regulator of RNase III)